jgi:hypothetical protein
MLYVMFILRIYLVCSGRYIIISFDGTSYNVEVEVEQHYVIKFVSDLQHVSNKTRVSCGLCPLDPLPELCPGPDGDMGR